MNDEITKRNEKYEHAQKHGWLDIADQQVLDAIKDWQVKEFCFHDLVERLLEVKSPVLRSGRSKNYVYQAITHLQDAEKLFYVGTKSCPVSARRIKHYSTTKQEERLLI